MPVLPSLSPPESGWIAYPSEVDVETDVETFRAAELHARESLTRWIEEGASGTEVHIWREYFFILFSRCGVPESALDEVGERLKEEHERAHLWTHVEDGTGEAREEGFRLGVVSNADGRIEDLLRKVGLRDRVEFVVDSHVIGVEKPDPRIFLEGARRMGVPPAECLYVGDLYSVDVLGARRAGMEAVLLDPSGRLERPVARIPSVLHLPEYLGGRSDGPDL